MTTRPDHDLAIFNLFDQASVLLKGVPDYGRMEAWSVYADEIRERAEPADRDYVAEMLNAQAIRLDLIETPPASLGQDQLLPLLRAFEFACHRYVKTGQPDSFCDYFGASDGPWILSMANEKAKGWTQQQLASIERKLIRWLAQRSS